jgi:microcystin-dependent protein
MAEPFPGEIRVVSFSFAPKGWALGNGQLLPINQNQTLFSLWGVHYGGDGGAGSPHPTSGLSGVRVVSKAPESSSGASLSGF